MDQSIFVSWMTSVRAIKSPSRCALRLTKIMSSPISPIGPSVSIGRDRLRRSTSTTLTGEPSTLITRKFSSRLPGVWPFQSHSKKLK